MNSKTASYRALTAKWSKFNYEAQRALSDLRDVECDIEALDRVSSGRDGLPPSLREHLSRIDNVNVGDLIHELLQAEIEDDTYLLEDGSAPTPEPEFIG